MISILKFASAARPLALIVALAVCSLPSVSRGQANDAGTGSVNTNNGVDDDDDGFNMGWLGLLGLAGLLGLKRRDDHVRVHDTART